MKHRVIMVHDRARQHPLLPVEEPPSPVRHLQQRRVPHQRARLAHECLEEARPLRCHEHAGVCEALAPRNVELQQPGVGARHLAHALPRHLVVVAEGERGERGRDAGRKVVQCLVFEVVQLDEFKVSQLPKALCVAKRDALCEVGYSDLLGAREGELLHPLAVLLQHAHDRLGRHQGEVARVHFLEVPLGHLVAHQPQARVCDVIVGELDLVQALLAPLALPHAHELHHDADVGRLHRELAVMLDDP
mmetsp:Transcript_40569/g.98621  ORF Transcript_40569/g.98621 Transcript_40569/m.98621 type:complete len:247 (+) Transcript_40569:2154-2894(+)